MAAAKDLDSQIAFYEGMKPKLDSEYYGKWVVFYGEAFEGSYDDFEAAAEEAVKRFGEGPYLIRKVGARPIDLPISVLYGGL